MHQQNVGRLRGIEALRREILQILIVAILISLGTNILASGISSYLGAGSWILIGSGFAISSLGLVAALFHLSTAMNSNFIFKGVLTLDKNKKSIVSVPRYVFAERAKENIEALCAEN